MPIPTDSLNIYANVVTATVVYGKFDVSYDARTRTVEVRNRDGIVVDALPDADMALVDNHTWVATADDGTVWDVTRAHGCRCGAGMIVTR